MSTATSWTTSVRAANGNAAAAPAAAAVKMTTVMATRRMRGERLTPARLPGCASRTPLNPSIFPRFHPTTAAAADSSQISRPAGRTRMISRSVAGASGERPDGADGWREEAVRRWGPLIGGGRVGTLIGGRVDESSAYPPASVKGGKNEGVKENVKMGMKEEVKMGVKEE
eukprot:6195771-Pleurochrysis_carterae.AAC.3